MLLCVQWNNPQTANTENSNKLHLTATLTQRSLHLSYIIQLSIKRLVFSIILVYYLGEALEVAE